MPRAPKPARLEWTVGRLLQWAGGYFAERAIDSPRTTADILLAHALKLRRIDLYLQTDRPLVAAELAAFKRLIRRRAAREPVAYITGRRDFWTLELAVTRDTLIPRPETECLVEAALARLPAAGRQRVLELGTGSGAVTLALASERPQAVFFATDRSPRALAVARENARAGGLEERVRFLAGDWFAPLVPGAGPFFLIVSNPPYIRSGEIDGLEPEIRCYEPRAALDGSADGLDALGRIIGRAPRYLAAGGWLLLEIGHDQRSQVAGLLEGDGAYEKIGFGRDYGGHDRVAWARRCPSTGR